MDMKKQKLVKNMKDLLNVRMQKNTDLTSVFLIFLGFQYNFDTREDSQNIQNCTDPESSDEQQIAD